MTVIRVLPADLASQIAAGEVVERPSSAVKELIENALDASATRCDVSIRGGGISEIGVVDDGTGMSAENARLCIERHATSKLSSLADLSKVRSFGFRGEALPSIASVSRFTLRTRARASDAGVELAIEGGAAPTLHAVGTPVGTSVQVRDLFYNVPARRKFLRSTGTEAGHVTEIVEFAALARHDVTITLERDGRRVREWLRAESREERVRDALAGEELAACRGERGPLRVEAFLSRPERARSGAIGLKILVNNRPVRDRALALTTAQAYGSVLERGRYPRGVLYLDLPPELVDVNVHPQKAEVRFADPRALTDALYSCLSKALASAFSLPKPARSAWANRPTLGAGSAPAPAPAPAAAAAPETGPDPWGLIASLPSEPAQTNSAGMPALRTPSNPEPLLVARDSATTPSAQRSEPKWSALRYIAQLRATYLLCEGEDGLYVLDQHAAAERVTFSRLRHAYQSRAVPSQSLLFPITLQVSQEEAALTEEYASEISEVGLDVRVRGVDLLSVHAVPKLLQNASPERLVRDLLSEVSRSGGRGFSSAVDLALATMACHGSIRAGDALSPAESAALLLALDEADFAGHCPHGRPIVAVMSYHELERKVGRR
ncbi:MAG TPA: DNA mismatch repair endonuclease MutL [Polyangiaceae bacterium]|nr:DNA mismatch repair endonuclease MutL [Polyangiaceae bacterium]